MAACSILATTLIGPILKLGGELNCRLIRRVGFAWLVGAIALAFDVAVFVCILGASFCFSFLGRCSLVFALSLFAIIVAQVLLCSYHCTSQAVPVVEVVIVFLAGRGLISFHFLILRRLALCIWTTGCHGVISFLFMPLLHFGDSSHLQTLDIMIFCYLNII
jgi:hypothetical protein